MTPIVAELVRFIARAFYGDEAVVILDALTVRPYIRVDEADKVLNMSERAFQTIANSLVADKMICSEELSDVKEDSGNHIPVTAVFYYIDEKQFVDMVRLRMHMIHERLQSNRPEEGSDTMWCPTCEKLRNTQDALTFTCRILRTAAPENLICVDCQGVLQEPEVQESYSGLFEHFAALRSGAACRAMHVKLEDNHKDPPPLAEARLHSINDMLETLKNTTVLRNLPRDIIAQRKRKRLHDAAVRRQTQRGGESSGHSGHSGAAGAGASNMSAADITVQVVGQKEAPAWSQRSSVTGQLSYDFGAAKNVLAASAAQPAATEAKRIADEAYYLQLQALQEQSSQPSETAPPPVVMPQLTQVPTPIPIGAFDTPMLEIADAVVNGGAGAGAAPAPSTAAPPALVPAVSEDFDDWTT